MKKFKFKLEPVLTVRESKEKQIQVELAAAFDRLDAAVTELNNIEAQRGHIAAKLEMYKQKPSGIEDLLIYQNYLENLDMRLILQKKRIEELEKEAEEIRLVLIQATKDKKIIEKLKTKHKNIHETHIFKQEISFLDEIGILRNARKDIK